MIDVLLVIIIFLMLTTTYSKFSGLEINLPTADASKQAEQPNEIDVAVVDASVEAHMLDHLIYGTNPRVNMPAAGRHRVMVAGPTCLAGDVFGDYHLAAPLSVGDGWPSVR